MRSTNHYAADSFSARLAFGLDPGLDDVFWASASNIMIDVAMSLDGGMTRREPCSGRRRPRRDRRASRDRSRRRPRPERGFDRGPHSGDVREPHVERDRDRCSAQRHGLQADVTETTTLVGRYYAAEHDSITLDQFSRATTEWGPPRVSGASGAVRRLRARADPELQPPFASSSDNLGAGRSDQPCARNDPLTLSGSIQVTVKSWNTRQQRAFTQTAGSASASGQDDDAAPAARLRLCRSEPDDGSGRARRAAEARGADEARADAVA